MNQYRDFVKNNHRLPKSVQDLSVNDNFYHSVADIEREIWKNYAVQTLDQCIEDEAFGEYIAREKLLAYIFTLLQNLNEDVKMLDLQFDKSYKWLNNPILKEFKQEYQSFVKILIEEGQERGEIQKRPYIFNLYPGMFWGTLVSILVFWSKDSSEYKEQTDVAVEKWVNLLFDTLSPNAVDSAFDLAQFIFKQNMNGLSK